MKISKITLSNYTVNRRILEVYSDIVKNVCVRKDLALHVDDPTDIINKALLIEFIRFINENLITNQFLFCKESSLTTKGEDVFNILNIYRDEWLLSCKSCVGICTDGASSMIGCNKGLVSLRKEQSEKVIVTHCYLHREVLMSRTI